MRTEGKSVGVSKVRPIVLYWIGVDSILFDPVVPEIFYFKHDVRASLIIIFIGNSDVSKTYLSQQKLYLTYM